MDAGNVSPHATWVYSWISPPSRSRRRTSSEGGMNVGWIENGDHIKVKGVAFGSGATSFTARVAAATSGGRIELHLDGVNGTLVGTCTVPGIGGWQTWTTVTCPVNGGARALSITGRAAAPGPDRAIRPMLLSDERSAEKVLFPQSSSLTFALQT
ncbi:carbohydrate-binding protein [Nonomuraea sp. NPDC049784]|uniref:carbohydrate-binding protein n=1 Tax=Nonomuraea sp. NPDC049784 TaxID=3154361 RepID=UPI00340183D3